MGIVGRLFSGSRPPENEIYLKLRHQALHVTTRDLGLDPDPASPIRAVIMETGHADAVATFVCLRDGGVSLYVSTGGGVIGAGQHERVRTSCVEMMTITNKYAADFMAASKPVSSFAYPGNGDVFFYLVTGNGAYQARCREDALAEQRDPFSALFNNCHAVMAEVRAIEEQQ